MTSASDISVISLVALERGCVDATLGTEDMAVLL